MDTGNSLERVYVSHHKSNRSDDFVLLGEERAGLIRRELEGQAKNVLDVGCRDGALVELYRGKHQVTGVDIDSEALSRARNKLGIETIHADLNGDWGNVPLRSYDAVVAAEVVEHLYFPENVFKKIASVLKREGVCVGTVPNAFSLKNRVRLLLGRKAGTPLSDPTHINHFTVEEMTSILKNNFHEVGIVGIGRFGRLAKLWPQMFAFDLFFVGRRPIEKSQ